MIFLGEKNTRKPNILVLKNTFLLKTFNNLILISQSLLYNLINVSTSLNKRFQEKLNDAIYLHSKVLNKE